MRTGKIVAGLCLIAGPTIGLAACGGETFEVMASEERAIETAEDAVAQIAQVYADMFREGEVSTVALDETTLSWVKDPELRDGFRHVAERLPEEAPWILKFSGLSMVYSTRIVAEVYDLHEQNVCCKFISADIVREDGGWRIRSVDFDAWGHESDEHREKRLARGAELREREALR